MKIPQCNSSLLIEVKITCVHHYTVGNCALGGRAIWIQSIYHLLHLIIPVWNPYCSLHSKLLIVLGVLNEWVSEWYQVLVFLLSLKQRSWCVASVHCYCTCTVLHRDHSLHGKRLNIPLVLGSVFSSKLSPSARQSHKTLPLRCTVKATDNAVLLSFSPCNLHSFLFYFIVFCTNLNVCLYSIFPVLILSWLNSPLNLLPNASIR